MAKDTKDVSHLERLKSLGEALAPARPVRIVDVGANPLEPAPYTPLLEAGLAELWAFEPHEEAFAALKAAPLPNTHVLPYAVGDGTRGVLHVCKASGFTSLLKPNQKFIEYVGRWKRMMRVIETVELETHRLDDLDDVPQIDLLKIDIQGGEQAVFEGGREKLSNVLGVITEIAAIPLYEGQPLLDDQMRILRGLGLDLHKFLFFKQIPLNHPTAGKMRGGAEQLIDGDAVFLRGLLDLANMDLDDLKRMALISDGALDGVNFTLQVLHVLQAKGAIDSRVIDQYFDALPGERKLS